MLDWKPVERCSLWAVEKEESRICRVLISVSFFVQLFLVLMKPILLACLLILAISESPPSCLNFNFVLVFLFLFIRFE